MKQDFTVLLVNTRLKLKELVMLLMKRDLLSKSLVHLDTFVMEPLEMLPFWLTQTNMVMVLEMKVILHLDISPPLPQLKLEQVAMKRLVQLELTVQQRERTVKTVSLETTVSEVLRSHVLQVFTVTPMQLKQMLLIIILKNNFSYPALRVTKEIQQELKLSKM